MNGAHEVPFLTREQAGRELFAVRPRPGWGYLAIVLVTIALGYGLAYLAPERSPVLAIAGAVGVLLVHLGVAGSGLLEKHRVCEHALVLGPTLPGTTPYVVPLSSIDPQSIRLHHRANYLGRRLGGLGARNLRMAVYSTKAVTFSGLHCELANEKLRRSSPLTMQAQQRPRYDNVPAPPAPSITWALGVRDPQPLLLALEQALVDSGQPAGGVSEQQLRDPIVEQPPWQSSRSR
jgi:hypothetical protein